MTLINYILILLTPLISYFTIKCGLIVKLKNLRIASISLTTLSLTILISPMSFTGEWIDFTILLLCLLTLYIYLFQQRGATINRLLKYIGYIFFVFVFLILESIYSQFTGAKDWTSYLSIEKITTDNNYRLIHRKVNTNFMYSGTHLITIKQTIRLLPVLEYQVATIDAGQYVDNAIPSQFEYLVDANRHRLIIKSGADTSIAF